MRARTRTEILTEGEKKTKKTKHESALMDFLFLSSKKKKKKKEKLRENQSFATTRGRTREANIKS